MFKNPLFFAAIVIVILIIVLVMLYRDVGNLRSSVVDVVKQHNNAKNALDAHAKAIGDLRTVFMGDGEDAYDDEEDIPHMDIVEEMDEDPEIKPDPSAKKRK
jgi:hypothetical protein